MPLLSFALYEDLTLIKKDIGTVLYWDLEQSVTLPSVLSSEVGWGSIIAL